MKIARSHHGKVILFGEYTVISTGEALALPMKSIVGFLNKNSSTNDRSTRYIKAFADYLETLKLPYDVVLDIPSLKKDLNDGLYLETNATIGYGIGSSGILTACVFRHYALLSSKLSLEELKHILAEMESFFHGNSSGLDPLISYLDQAIVLGKNNIELLDGLEETILSRFYLLDTGITRNTEPLVKWYKEQLNKPVFRDAMDQMSLLVKQSIQATLLGGLEDLTLIMKQLSAHQLVHLNRLIPESVIEIWEKGLENDDYYLKLCGAGGGGYMLVFVVDGPPMVEQELIPLT